MNTTTKQPLVIVLLNGGWSAERELSAASAQHVMKTLTARGHECCFFDPASMSLETYPWHKVDVAINLIHGATGEDGTIHGLLHEFDVPITGCDADVSRSTFTRSSCKKRLRKSVVATPPWKLIGYSSAEKEYRSLAKKIGYPLVVKPNSGGCGHAISHVHRESELSTAVILARRFEPQVMFEQLLEGTDWTVTVANGRTLPVIDMTCRGLQFDSREESRLGFGDLEQCKDSNLCSELQNQAVDVFDSLGCQGVVTVSFRGDAHGKPQFIEINTVPGMTDRCIVPANVRLAGEGFGEFLENELIHPLKQIKTTELRRAA